VLASLHDSGTSFVIGGTYALERLAGVTRRTKDLDLFILEEEWPAIQRALAGSGVEAHIEFPHWLAKANRGSDLVDLIFAGGNGLVGTPTAEAFRRAGYDVRALPHAALDICDEAAVARRMDDDRPGVVVNCAAYTKVDECEKQVELAMRVNGAGAGVLARHAAGDVQALPGSWPGHPVAGLLQRPAPVPRGGKWPCRSPKCE